MMVGGMEQLPRRKSTRLQGYDYSQNGIYFITICAHGRRQIFCQIPQDVSQRESSSMRLTQYGEIVEKELLKMPIHFNGVTIDKYVIMPNHVHMLISLGCGDAAERSRPFPTMSTIVGLYKSGVSKAVHQTQPEVIIWQKSFHDHIIRNEAEYLKIWEYIDTNPLKWELDCFYE